LLLATSCRRSRLDAPDYAHIESLRIRGEVSEATIAVNRALAQHPADAWTDRLLISAARLSQDQKQTDQVIHLLTVDWKPTTDPDSTAERLCLLSLAYSKKSEGKKSADALQQASDLRGLSPVAQSDVLAAQGRVALQQNRLPEAAALFEKNAALAHADHNSFAEAVARLNLGYLYLRQDQYERAIEESRAAQEIAASAHAQTLVEGAQGNAAWAYFETGDYQRALLNFREAATLAAELGSVLNEEAWSSAGGLAEARLGNIADARRDYQHALILARSLKDSSEILDVEEPLASLYLRIHRPDQALPYIHEAHSLAKQTGDQDDIQFADLLSAQYLAQLGNSQVAITQLLTLQRQPEQLPSLHLTAQHTLADLYAASKQPSQADLWYRRALATYRAQREALTSDDTRLPFFANGRDVSMDYVAFLVHQHRTADALAVVDQGRAETLSEDLDQATGPKYSQARPHPISLIQLARRAHAVILVYALSPQGSYLWAANSKQSGFYTLPDRATILSAIKAHHRAILAARDILREQEPAARQLYGMLVAPAASLIHPGDRVYIVADDGMHGLNFGTLLTPGPGSHFWIEDVILTNLSSARRLARSQPAKGDRLLVIGNPVYAGTSFSPLPNAAAEVADVAGHFPAALRTEITGPAATPDAYLASRPGRYKYIHFVSHAVSSEIVPLDSAVILSPPVPGQTAEDANRLYARQILSQPLDADLVTISACQGSGIRAYAGEGLVGLAWAFLRAGSHNVIGALWDVSDASTPALMQHLYDGIAHGQPPDAALRNAQLQMLHAPGIFRKPLYWSAFQLYAAGS